MCQQERGPLIQSTCRQDLEHGAGHWAPHYHRQIGGARGGWEQDEGAARAGLRRKIKRLKYVQTGQVTGQPRSPHARGRRILSRKAEILCRGEMGWYRAEGRHKWNLKSFWAWLWKNSEPWNSLLKETAECPSLGMFQWSWAERDKIPRGPNPGNALGASAQPFTLLPFASLSLLVVFLLVYSECSHNLKLLSTKIQVLWRTFTPSQGTLIP